MSPGLSAAAGSRPSHPVYRTLSATGVPRLRRWMRGGAQVFCFHGVVADANGRVGDEGLHMTRAHFERILEWIRSTYEVLPLTEVVRRLSAGAPLGGTAALTFDDAYRGFFEHGLPILRREGVPASIFVVGEASRSPTPFWWDLLGRAETLDAERREHCLEALRGDAGRVLDHFGPVVDANLPASHLPVPWDELAHAAADDLIELGAHTMRHRNLAVLDRGELDAELRDAREMMELETGRAPEHVSYPYGRWSPAVVRAARAAGYRAGFTLEHGTVRAGSEALALPRLNVPAGIGVEALDCWAAGLRRGRGDA